MGHDRGERDVHHRAVRRRQDEPAVGREVLPPDDPRPPQHRADRGDDRADDSVEEHQAIPAARASSRTSATTSSMLRPVVSSSTASAAGRSGDAARPLSSASRRAKRALHFFDCDRALRRGFVELTPAGPLLVARGQEDLDRRRGEHHRSDVAAFDDTGAVLGDPVPLTRHQNLHAPAGGRRPSRPPRSRRVRGSRR